MSKKMVIKYADAKFMAVLAKASKGLIELVNEEAEDGNDIYTAVRNTLDSDDGVEVSLLLLYRTVELSEISKYVCMKKTCQADEVAIVGLDYISCKELNKRVRDFIELAQIIAGVGLDFHGELAETFGEWDADDFIEKFEEALDYVSCICEGAGFDVDFELDDEDEVA